MIICIIDVTIATDFLLDKDQVQQALEASQSSQLASIPDAAGSRSPSPGSSRSPRTEKSEVKDKSRSNVGGEEGEKVKASGKKAAKPKAKTRQVKEKKRKGSGQEQSVTPPVPEVRVTLTDEQEHDLDPEYDNAPALKHHARGPHSSLGNLGMAS